MALRGRPVDLQASLRSLAQGGLPARAQLRLADEAGPARKLFTSDLSTSEFLLSRQIGTEPISQVMGSSIYHIGRIADYKGKTGEIVTISNAHREARRLALGRLALEAAAVGANVVVGVHLAERLITKGAHGKGGDDGDQVIEFTVVGTAARAPWLGRQAEPVLTDLSGQDLWALVRDGWAPCGIVFEFCRFHVFHVMGNDRRAGGEIASATAGIDRARELVVTRVTAQAEAAGAELVVGSDITVDVHEVPCGWEGCRLNDLDIDVSWFATPIRRHKTAHEVAHPEVPSLILGMMPLGRRKRGELLEGIESEDAELREEGRREEEEAAEEDDE